MNTTILVLDADTSVRLSLGKLLKQEGYEVLHLSDAASAINLMRSSAASLVLLDLDMEHDVGWSVLEAKRTFDLPVPILATTSRFDQRNDALAAGAGALIEKPLDVPTLLATVEALLNNPGHQAAFGSPDLARLDARSLAPLRLSSGLITALELETKEEKL